MLIPTWDKALLHPVLGQSHYRKKYTNYKYCNRSGVKKKLENDTKQETKSNTLMSEVNKAL